MYPVGKHCRFVAGAALFGRRAEIAPTETFGISVAALAERMRIELG